MNEFHITYAVDSGRNVRPSQLYNGANFSPNDVDAHPKGGLVLRVKNATGGFLLNSSPRATLQ